MTMTGKVVGFVTRPSPTRPQAIELLVFQHPMAGVQLPAGSLYDGEDAASGGPREVHEETGLDIGKDDVEIVREIATWTEPDSGLTRHAYHLRCLRETPDQWWVVTPDGDGLCWRCHWVPLDGTEPLHPLQRPWLDRARPDLVKGEQPRSLRPWPAPPPEIVGPTTVDVFMGTNLVWYSGTWLPGEDDSIANEAGQSIGVAVTADGDAVIVRHREGGEFLPGGTREQGETLRETLDRELHEEACATVVDAELLGHLRIAIRDDDGNLGNLHYGSRWWARVALDEWEPEWEMVGRRLVPYTDVVGAIPAWRFPENERWITAGIDAERRRRRPA